MGIISQKYLKISSTPILVILDILDILNAGTKLRFCKVAKVCEHPLDPQEGRQEECNDEGLGRLKICQTWQTWHLRLPPLRSYRRKRTWPVCPVAMMAIMAMAGLAWKKPWGPPFVAGAFVDPWSSLIFHCFHMLSYAFFPITNQNCHGIW